MMASMSLMRKLRIALPIAFLAAAAVAGCHSMDEARGGEHGSGHGEEESGTMLGLDETFDQVRRGAHLILRYNAEANAFVGTVTNTTDDTLPRVRVEVHLSNGTELGPTTPQDLVPGQTVDVRLPATATPFTGWSAHAEVGGSGSGAERGGGEAGGEHGERGERGGEHG